MLNRNLWSLSAVATLALMILPALVLGGERLRTIKRSEYNPAHETVELFAAMEAGQIDAKIILKDSTKGRVFLTNKTKQPINVKLPDAFVAVHKQGFGGGVGGGGQGGGNQTGGGGMGGGGMGGGGQGGGGNFFNVPAERIGELEVPCVCLEHGKDDPKPKLEYELKPVEAFSSDPQLKQLLSMFGYKGLFPQRVAQAAAWHLTDKMSWQELAAKRIERLNGASYPYFSPQELRLAIRMVGMANARAEEAKKVEGQTVTEEKVSLKE